MHRLHCACLTLTLLTPALACVDGGIGDPDTTTNTATDTDTGTDTGEGEGMCVDVTPIEPVIDLLVDGAPEVPDLETDCTVLTAEVADGTLSVSLSCTNADPNAMDHIVEVSAPGDAVPAGLEPDASVSLKAGADQSGEFGPGPRFELSGADGPILAQIQYAKAATTWGWISLGYASYCEAGEMGETGSGYVEATVVGAEDDLRFEVFVGEPQIITDGAAQWELHALDATDVCCHGWQIGASLIRR